MTSAGAMTGLGLLEREPFEAALEEWLGEARCGRGRLVLLAGEAGIGKTALVRRFSTRERGPRVLWGACDGLRTPRPLGPFVDIAAAIWTPRGGSPSPTGSTAPSCTASPLGIRSSSPRCSRAG